MCMALEPGSVSHVGLAEITTVWKEGLSAKKNAAIILACSQVYSALLNQ